MLRDNLVGLIEPMLSSAGANPLALCTARKKPSDDRPSCLENPRPEGAESTLTENAASPFHAEPRHERLQLSASDSQYSEVGWNSGPYQLCWCWSRTFGNGQDGTWFKQPTGGKTVRIFPVFEVKKEIYAKLLVKTLVLLEVRIWFEQIRSFRHFCCLPGCLGPREGGVWYQLDL